jgi:hypothetical protein
LTVHGKHREIVRTKYCCLLLAAWLVGHCPMLMLLLLPVLLHLEQQSALADRVDRWIFCNHYTLPYLALCSDQETDHNQENAGPKTIYLCYLDSHGNPGSSPDNNSSSSSSSYL